MRETANNTTGRTNSAYLSGGIREDIRALGGLFGEDFTDTANFLLDMADDAAAVNVEDTNSGSAVHVLRSVSQLGSMIRKMLADQNRAYLDGKRVNALDTGAEIVAHLNKRKLAEKEFSNIETDQKGRIKTDSGYGLRNIFRNRFMLNAMSGYDFLHRLGGAGDKLYETLRESQSEQVMHVKEYTDFTLAHVMEIFRSEGYRVTRHREMLPGHNDRRGMTRAQKQALDAQNLALSVEVAALSNQEAVEYGSNKTPIMRGAFCWLKKRGNAATKEDVHAV